MAAAVAIDTTPLTQVVLVVVVHTAVQSAPEHLGKVMLEVLALLTSVLITPVVAAVELELLAHLQ